MTKRTLTPCTNDATGSPCWQVEDDGERVVLCDLDGEVYQHCAEWTACGPAIETTDGADWPDHPGDRRTEEEKLRDAGF
jgi:hypothetical protein